MFTSDPDVLGSPARLPFAGAELLAFLGARAVPGLESWDGTTYRRTLDLPAGHSIALAARRPPERRAA